MGGKCLYLFVVVLCLGTSPACYSAEAKKDPKKSLAQEEVLKEEDADPSLDPDAMTAAEEEANQRRIIAVVSGERAEEINNFDQVADASLASTEQSADSTDGGQATESTQTAYLPVEPTEYASVSSLTEYSSGEESASQVEGQSVTQVAYTVPDYSALAPEEPTTYEDSSGYADYSTPAVMPVSEVASAYSGWDSLSEPASEMPVSQGTSEFVSEGQTWNTSSVSSMPAASVVSERVPEVASTSSSWNSESVVESTPSPVAFSTPAVMPTGSEMPASDILGGSRVGSESVASTFEPTSMDSSGGGSSAVHEGAGTYYSAPTVADVRDFDADAGRAILAASGAPFASTEGEETTTEGGRDLSAPPEGFEGGGLASQGEGLPQIELAGADEEVSLEKLSPEELEKLQKAKKASRKVGKGIFASVFGE